MERFYKARVGTQLASVLIWMKSWMASMLMKFVNHLELGVITKVCNDGAEFQKDVVKEISESHQKREW